MAAIDGLAPRLRRRAPDRDHDGHLNITELSNFLRFVTYPDLRALHAWDRYK